MRDTTEMRQTSIDCYHQIEAEGLLSKMRLKMLGAILHNAPCTASEAFTELECKTNQSGRITELKELGVIYETGMRKCRITGRRVIEWDLTDNLPVTPPKKETAKQQRINDALEALRELFKKRESRDQWLKVADAIKSI